MRANVIQVYPFNIDKVKLLTMRGAPGARGPKGDPGNFQLDQLVPTNSAAGSIASFADGGNDLPVEDLKVKIQPKQDLHGYANPWPGGGNSNLLPELSTQTKNGLTFTADRGQYTVSGTPSATTDFDVTVSIPAGTYTFAAFNPATSNYAYLILITQSGTGNTSAQLTAVNRTYTFTTTETSVKLRIRFYTGQTFSNFKISPMLVSGSTAPSSFTPYSNICPITGWDEAKVTRAGKNLANLPLNSYNNNNVYTGAVALKKGTYTFSFSYGNTPDGIYLRRESTATSIAIAYVYNSKKLTFTLEDDEPTLYFFIYKSGGITTEDVTDLQLELGSTATPYEPYQGTTITIPLGSTVYGGTLDVTTGVLKVEEVKHVASLSDSTGLYQAGTNANRVGIRLSDSPLTAVSERLNIISNIAKASTDVLSSATQAVGDCCMYSGGSDTFSTAVFGVPKTATSASAALSWLVDQGCEFVYKLATPVTVQLTAQQLNTLLGVNNIWSDAGDTSVEYYANTKLYIDLAGQTEDDMTANANIASGRYFQIGNTLYISTAAIAAGETIVPGTNCRKTTIAEALNALL